MKIRCIYNQWKDVGEDIIPNDNNSKRESDFHIDVGTEYIVYGLTVRDGVIWYYIGLVA